MPLLLDTGHMAKCKELGLAVSYIPDLFIEKISRRLTCLSFLPHEHVPSLFTNMISLDTPTSFTVTFDPLSSGPYSIAQSGQTMTDHS